MSKTKYFLDTEFIEDGRTIDLLSIGLVRETGESLYLQNSGCSFHLASEWVWRNVFPHLKHFSLKGKRQCEPRAENDRCTDNNEDPCPWATRSEIKKAVLNFCDPARYGKPEFWGYFADYDWVAFCQLFGTMMDLPKGFPMYCRDIKQLADSLGDIRIPKPEIEIHHALVDAQWVQSAYEFLGQSK